MKAIAVVVAVGCSANDGGAPATPDETETHENEPVGPLAFGGQTGSGSASPCIDDDLCADIAEARRALWASPDPVAPLLDARCVQPTPDDADPEFAGSVNDFAAGEVCACRFACANERGERIGQRGGEIGHGVCNDLSSTADSVWVGVRANWSRAFLDRWSRSYLEDYDFEGCDPNAPAESCDELCHELERRWHAAAPRVEEATVTSAICGGTCQIRYETDDACYAQLSRDISPISCIPPDQDAGDRDAAIYDAGDEDVRP